MSDAPAKRHSEDWFGEQRDHWWNPDFLELMARRWDLARCKRILDLGAGVGHWGRALAPFLSEDASVIGLEREPAWVAKAAQEAAARGLAERFTYLQGVAEALPFADASFDAVTCQTVLMHLPDVPRVLAEVRRVLVPGGIFIAVEPNNRAAAVLESTTEVGTPIAWRLAQLRLHVLCEQGKTALGEGDNVVGERLPQLFTAAGFAELKVYLCDKTYAYVPPYVSADEQARIADHADAYARELFIADKATCARYYLAAGGSAEDFAADWDHYRALQRRTLAALAAGTHAESGGAINYLVSGRKPAP